MACHKPGEKRANAAPQGGGEAFLARRFGSDPALFMRTGRESLSSFTCSIRSSRRASNHRLAELRRFAFAWRPRTFLTPVAQRCVGLSAHRTCAKAQDTLYI